MCIFVKLDCCFYFNSKMAKNMNCLESDHVLNFSNLTKMFLVASRLRRLYILYSSSFFFFLKRFFLMSKFCNFFGSQLVPTRPNSLQLTPTRPNSPQLAPTCPNLSHLMSRLCNFFGSQLVPTRPILMRNLC